MVREAGRLARPVSLIPGDCRLESPQALPGAMI